MKRYLFVYGTLRSDFASPAYAEYMSECHLLGPARISGQLYDLGSYPGVKLEGTDVDTVIGEVFQIPDDRAWLNALDQYEGYDPENAAESLFIRSLCMATHLDDSSEIKCWVYIYNRPVTAGRRIPAGDFLDR